LWRFEALKRSDESSGNPLSVQVLLPIALRKKLQARQLFSRQSNGQRQEAHTVSAAERCDTGELLAHSQKIFSI
jgi:hypothetical protein